MLIAACPTLKAAAYSISVADATTVEMITLIKLMGAFGAAPLAQSPSKRIPPARDHASDSLRYDPSL